MKKVIFLFTVFCIAIIAYAVFATQTDFQVKTQDAVIESKCTGTSDDSVYTAVFTSTQRFSKGFNVGINNTGTNTINFIVRTYVRFDSTVPDTLVSDSLATGENYFIDRGYPVGKVQVLLQSALTDSHSTYIVDCIGAL